MIQPDKMVAIEALPDNDVQIKRKPGRPRNPVAPKKDPKVARQENAARARAAKAAKKLLKDNAITADLKENKKKITSKLLTKAEKAQALKDENLVGEPALIGDTYMLNTGETVVEASNRIICDDQGSGLQPKVKEDGTIDLKHYDILNDRYNSLLNRFEAFEESSKQKPSDKSTVISGKPIVAENETEGIYHQKAPAKQFYTESPQQGSYDYSPERRATRQDIASHGSVFLF